VTGESVDRGSEHAAEDLRRHGPAACHTAHVGAAATVTPEDSHGALAVLELTADVIQRTWANRN
jgi:hypothetical protein